MSGATSSQLLIDFFANKDIAKNYAFAERATALPAQSLIRQAGLHPDAPNSFEVLDNACGTGVVTAALYEAFKGNESKLKIVCGDLSENMVIAIRSRIAQMGSLDVEARILNGQAMDMPANQFTHVLTNFGFQSFPEPLLGLRESIRVTKPGGVIGMTNWVNPGWLPAFRLAVTRIPGAPPSMPEPHPFLTRSGRWFEVGWTREQLEAFPEIDPKTIDIQHHSFTMSLKSEEDVRAFAGPLQSMLDIITAQWGENERRACAKGILAEAIVQAMIEEPVLVWSSLVTTAQKRISQ